MGPGADVRWERWLPVAGVATALLVLLPYAQSAAALVAYPWDWFPDEGLYLDYARRVVSAPGSLYAHAVSPAPDFYGPVLPLLLAPLVRTAGAPFVATRLLACLWTALIAGAVFVLVRRRAPVGQAALAVALVLVPGHLSFWFLLVRPDGPMLAFWLWAAVVCLPLSLRRGADSLSWPRAAGGALLLALATFSKPTAVLHGAPLVLGWLLVDTRGALRLGGLLAGMVAAVVSVLQAVSHGGYLRNLVFWTTHERQPGLLEFNLRFFLAATGPIVALTLLGLLASLWRREKPWGDSTLLLVLGGLVIVPTLGKYGALAHYLLPLLCGLVVVAGRCWWPREQATRARLAATLASVATALVLARTQFVPLPPRGSAATAQAFYGAVAALVREGGRPLLALRPEYAYFHVGQRVEVEGSGFKFLFAAGAPGSGEVLARLERRAYGAVALLPMGVTEDEPIAQALHRQYVSLGSCQLSYYSGLTTAILMVPRDRPARFDPPSGTRCSGAAPVAP